MEEVIDYKTELEKLKEVNKEKIISIKDKLVRCTSLEEKLLLDLKNCFNYNDKLYKTQTIAEDLFFSVCKNLQVKF